MAMAAIIALATLTVFAQSAGPQPSAQNPSAQNPPAQPPSSQNPPAQPPSAQNVDELNRKLAELEKEVQSLRQSIKKLEDQQKRKQQEEQQKSKQQEEQQKREPKQG